MSYSLDANVLIALLKRNEGVVERARQHELATITIPAIVMHELCFGAFRSRRREASLRDLGLLPFQIVEFSARDAWEAGRIRAQLADRGMPIGPYDSLIAAQALTRGLTLVTRNTREFARVEGLKLENWEDGP